MDKFNEVEKVNRKVHKLSNIKMGKMDSMTTFIILLILSKRS